MGEPRGIRSTEPSRRPTRPRARRTGESFLNQESVSAATGENLEGTLVSPDAHVGVGTRIWGLAQVREKAWIGDHCIIGTGVYIDAAVRIGDRCKIQNGAQVYAPATIGEGVFIGPNAVITNDEFPRAVTASGDLKLDGDWEPAGVIIEDGASIGAGAVVLAGVTVGNWAMLGAGAVAVEDLPPRALAVGVPARRIGWLGNSGRRLIQAGDRFFDPETQVAFVEVDGRLVEDK